MQQTTFAPDPIKFITRTSNDLFTAVDERRNSLEESQNSRWHCIKSILYEQFLWDMRCWKKPRHLYTKPEVATHIQKWLKDDEEGNWTCNCTGCLYCIRKLLEMKWANLQEIADYAMRNTTVTYIHAIGTWGNGFGEEEDEEIPEYTESLEFASECGNCGSFIDENEDGTLVSETRIRCGRCINL